MREGQRGHRLAERKGLHTKGLQWGGVERRMEKWIRRLIRQGLREGLDPGDGLKEKDRPNR